MQGEKIERVLVGLDLGKFRDPSAAVTVESVQKYRQKGRGIYISTDGVEQVGEPFYRVQHIERPPLETNYKKVRERVAEMMENIKNHYGLTPELVIDAGGVGSVMFDEFVQMEIRPIGIVFSAGFKPGLIHTRVYSVPKLDLANMLDILTINNRFAINQNIPLAGVLRKELETFKAKMSDTGNLTVEHEKITDHDDIVFATCMALWWAEYKRGKRPGQIKRSDLGI